MSVKKLRPSFTFTEDRLEQLKKVVPEAFADGRVNWDTLREALGEWLEDEETEHFGLTWPGKREARRLAALPPKGTLLPVPGEGVDEETTQNIFIEGENLEVLKLLQKSYAGRVKMIYIDPPYNTGNDFIYPDDYSEPLETYLRRTGGMDEAGSLLTTNTRASGRFHSNWLNMMYPRLLLARQLLHEAGVIFVSIDDNEVHHLRQLMNEVFGEENFITTFVWEKTQHFGRQKENFYSNVDYVIVYAKNLYSQQSLKRRLLVERLLDELEDAPLYNASNPTNQVVFPSGSTVFKIPDGVYTQTEDDKYRLLSPVEVRNGRNVEDFILEFKSRWSPETVIEEFEKGAQFLIKSANFAVRVIYQDDKTSLSSPKQLLFTNPNNPHATYSRFKSKVGTNEEGTVQLNELLGIKIEHMYPKPVSLIGYLLSLLYDEDEERFVGDGIVLDFFAGSSSTAQAVFEVNRSIGTGNLSFVIVQLPEPTKPDSVAQNAGFQTIAEIGKERIRRVSAKMKAEREGQMDLNPDEDLGFKVFRLSRSNFREWEPFVGSELAQLEMQFDQHVTPLVDGWQERDLLIEVMLQEGFPLHSKISLQEGFQENRVYLVEADFHVHRLFICLDKNIADLTIQQLALRTEDVFVCLDSALTDQSKARLADACNLHVI